MDTLARSWKVFVIAAALCGVVGFFEPYVAFDESGLELSAWRILVGYDKLADVPHDLGVALADADTYAGREALRKLNEAIKSDWVTLISRDGFARHETTPSRNMIPIVFGIAALLLALLALNMLLERTLSTLAAWGVLLVSLVALWGFMRGWFAIRGFDAQLCAGAYMHLACALLGFVGGAGALVKDDPGGFIGPDGLFGPAGLFGKRSRIPPARIRQ